jgi:hypothetical protein
MSEKVLPGRWPARARGRRPILRLFDPPDARSFRDFIPFIPELGDGVRLDAGT